MGRHVRPKRRRTYPSPVGYLRFVGANGGLVDDPDKDVVVFVLGKAGTDLRLVREVKGGGEGTRESHLLFQSPLGRRFRGFPGARVAAAGIGPEPTGVIFPGGPPLDEKPSRLVEDER